MSNTDVHGNELPPFVEKRNDERYTIYHGEGKSNIVNTVVREVKGLVRKTRDLEHMTMALLNTEERNGVDAYLDMAATSLDTAVQRLEKYLKAHT